MEFGGYLEVNMMKQSGIHAAIVRAASLAVMMSLFIAVAGCGRSEPPRGENPERFAGFYVYEGELEGEADVILTIVLQLREDFTYEADADLGEDIIHSSAGKWRILDDTTLGFDEERVRGDLLGENHYQTLSVTDEGDLVCAEGWVYVKQSD